MITSTVAQQIKQMRYQQHLTQEQFAAKIGITSNTLSRWERGVHKPQGVVLEMMKRMFLSPVSVDKVVDESSEA